MKIILKNFLAYEPREAEHYLNHMNQKGYTLTRVCHTLFFFKRQTESHNYYVLSAETSADLQEERNRLTEAGWTLIGENGKMAFFSGNGTPPVSHDDQTLSIRKSIRRHLLRLTLPLAAILILFIARCIMIKGNQFLIYPSSAPMLFLFAFPFFAALLCIAAELVNLSCIHPPTGERTPFSRILFTAGDLLILALPVILAAFSIYSIRNGPIELTVTILGQWILWPMGVIAGSTKKGDFIYALFYISFFTFVLVR